MLLRQNPALLLCGLLLYKITLLHFHGLLTGYFHPSSLRCLLLRQNPALLLCGPLLYKSTLLRFHSLLLSHFGSMVFNGGILRITPPSRSQFSAIPTGIRGLSHNCQLLLSLLYFPAGLLPRPGL